MKKGDVWIVDIPELKGHEQQGVRPAFVVADTPTPVAVVIPCTSNLQALRFPYTLLIDPTHKNGLTVSSVALVLQMRAIDKRRLKQQIGTLEETLVDEVNLMMKHLLAL
jgi:mRNA interferase MazF